MTRVQALGSNLLVTISHTRCYDHRRMYQNKQDTLYRSIVFIQISSSGLLLEIIRPMSWVFGDFCILVHSRFPGSRAWSHLSLSLDRNKHSELRLFTHRNLDGLRSAKDFASLHTGGITAYCDQGRVANCPLIVVLSQAIQGAVVRIILDYH